MKGFIHQPCQSLDLSTLVYTSADEQTIMRFLTRSLPKADLKQYIYISTDELNVLRVYGAGWGDPSKNELKEAVLAEDGSLPPNFTHGLAMVQCPACGWWRTSDLEGCPTQICRPGSFGDWAESLGFTHYTKEQAS